MKCKDCKYCKKYKNYHALIEFEDEYKYKCEIDEMDIIDAEIDIKDFCELINPDTGELTKEGKLEIFRRNL